MEREALYEIRRFYREKNGYTVVRKGLTLEEAQTHCNDPSTREEGVWFDGYEQMTLSESTVYHMFRLWKEIEERDLVFDTPTLFEMYNEYLAMEGDF